MSGVKIDLDAAREQNAFVKTSIVIQEEKITPQVITEETLEEAVAKPVKEGSGAKVAIITEQQQEAPPKSANNSSSRAIADAIKEAVNSSRKNEAEKARSSTRAASSRRPTTRLGDDTVPSNPYAERLPGFKNSADRPKIPDVEPPEKKAEIPELDPNRPDAAREEIDMMPKTEGELRQFWLSRIQIIKTRFHDVVIPRKAGEMTWQELRKIYYIELDRVSIGKNVDSYKTILAVMFIICEGVGAKFLKIDCTGFFAHSSRSMHRYDNLLIELGEKNYSSFGENWPVEARLGIMVLVNFVIFCIAKYLFKLTNQDMSDNFFDMFQNMGNANVESDLGLGAGMDAPGPTSAAGGDPNAGGLGGILSGLMGALGGKGGGLGDILGGLMGNMGGTPKPGATNAAKPTEDAEGGRVPPPKYRRKKKPAE